MVRSRTRRGNTLLDLVLSIMLAGAAIAPALSMISSQLETTRWARERVT
ncbi:MAG: hypothetical protein HY815_05770, partial [Candidatus Riflebacteria bacterium]|nr:hypothetical protein [Candidatus Riflebacteria bacterium]